MSIFFRLRSNPACNIEDGPPLSSLLGDSRSVSPEEALLHGSPYLRDAPTVVAPSVGREVEPWSERRERAADLRLIRRATPGHAMRLALGAIAKCLGEIGSRLAD